MGDTRTPGERLLEMMVFAPAGLAVTVVEEFPKLVEKGRHRLEGQVHTARLVGQFAMQMGRRRLDEAVTRLGERGDAHRHHGAPTADADAPDHAGGGDRVGDRATVSADTGLFVAPPVGADDAVSSLAIPNYDSLSASQVVQRLDGLAPAELRDVRTHEGAHRRRRTILHRVDQLLDG
ncbi:MAG TPA: hypothetical protein VGS21_01005, partial [Acidimicrobiales bacterium]|nr:hypothetical protein [Acidimicrobiales bacterium]